MILPTSKLFFNNLMLIINTYTHNNTTNSYEKKKEDFKEKRKIQKAEKLVREAKTNDRNEANLNSQISIFFLNKKISEPRNLNEVRKFNDIKQVINKVKQNYIQI